MNFRHCASCLLLIELSNAIICDKCNRRAYCSKECQTNDWESLQEHKHWCELMCGEEDIDWELFYGVKGYGIRAKRTILPLERIMVDGSRKNNDPVVNDLHPLDGTIEEKEDVNRLECDTNDQRILCARLSRVNHSCNRNAFHKYDNTYNVKILFAEREIQPGEEICITYTPWDDPSSSVTPEIARLKLQKHWQIICDSTCLCYDEGYITKIKKVKKLDQQIYKPECSVYDSLKCIEELENLYNEMSVKYHLSLYRLYYDRFQLSIRRGQTISQGVEYMNKAYNIIKLILHPDSKKVLESKSIAESLLMVHETIDEFLKSEREE
mmetsp:Transcript_2391/g.2142  ORF Transcript_2391/g.2142 Transcript_2391/m.2142 type:complete len:324 (-) Transcript_2391:15-986(-)